MCLIGNILPHQAQVCGPYNRVWSSGQCVALDLLFVYSYVLMCYVSMYVQEHKLEMVPLSDMHTHVRTCVRILLSYFKVTDIGYFHLDLEAVLSDLYSCVGHCSTSSLVILHIEWHRFVEMKHMYLRT
jgi:hypothetical protein